MEQLKEITMHAKYLWFFGGLVGLLIEFLAPSLIFFFFGLSAMIVGIIVFFFDISPAIQWSIFLALSITLIIVLRKRFKNVFYGETELKYAPTTTEYVGKYATVKTKLSAVKSGKVEFNGSLWSAFASETIEVGTTVKIIKKDNITLYVETIKASPAET